MWTTRRPSVCSKPLGPFEHPLFAVGKIITRARAVGRGAFPQRCSLRLLQRQRQRVPVHGRTPLRVVGLRRVDHLVLPLVLQTQTEPGTEAWEKTRKKTMAAGQYFTRLRLGGTTGVVGPGQVNPVCTVFFSFSNVRIVIVNVIKKIKFTCKKQTYEINNTQCSIK